MTRSQTELDRERRLQLVLSRAKLQFTAYFAQRRLPWPAVLEKELDVLASEACRIGDLCAYERKAVDSTPVVEVRFVRG